MIIFIFLVLEIFLLKIFFHNKGNNLKNNKRYSIIIGFSIVVISSLRHYTVGTDTSAYISYFNWILKTPISEFIYWINDPGFFFIMKLLSYISSDSRILLIFVAILFGWSTTRFIYRYSSFPEISFLMLLSLNFVSFSMTGLRQTLAISILLFSYDYLINRKYFKVALIIILASFFHQTAFIFLLALGVFFIRKILVQKIFTYLFAISIIYLAYFFRNSIINYFITGDFIIESGYVVGQEGSGILTMLIFITILFFSFMHFNLWKKNKQIIFLNYFLILSIIFQMFVPLVSEFFRVSMYFNIFSILLVPAIINNIPYDSGRMGVYFIISLLFLVVYFGFTVDDGGVVPYLFFWES